MKNDPSVAVQIHMCKPRGNYDTLYGEHETRDKSRIEKERNEKKRKKDKDGARQ